MPKASIFISRFNEFKDFLRYIAQDKERAFKIALLSLIFIITPTQNYYSKLEIEPDRPVLREIEVELPEINIVPVNLNKTSLPYISAKSALIIDVSSRSLMYNRNPDEKVLPASTTKIMTALVAINYWKPEDVLEVKRLNGIGQSMKLEKGEQITFGNLLYGLLVQSGNDAAYTLADNYPGGMDSFVKAMNDKALKLQLLDTNFVNPAGVEDDGHITTAHDLAVLASEAIQNETILKVVSTPEIYVTDVSGEIVHKLTNINELVGKIDGVKGLKTGWTENAGECLVSYVERNDRKIIIVLLNSTDRFGETVKLIDWVFDNYEWQTIESIQN